MNKNYDLALALGNWIVDQLDSTAYAIKEFRTSAGGDIVNALQHGYPLLTICIGEQIIIDAKRSTTSIFDYRFDVYYIWQDIAEKMNVEKFICGAIDIIRAAILNDPGVFQRTPYSAPPYSFQNVNPVHINTIGPVLAYHDAKKDKDYNYRLMNISMFGK